MKNIFNNKKILITGHTGFKGSWLSLLLKRAGAIVSGYSLAPVENPIFDASHISVFTRSWYEDIRNAAKIKEAITAVQPDIVFHLAAQPLVIDSYKNPLYTFETNVMGTANLLEALRNYSGKCAVIVITTDKVYENLEWVYPYRETDRLGGHDPYSTSKACAELVVQSYRKSFFSPEKIEEHGIALATARAGNVIGGGDWSANRIIPDMVKAFHVNETLVVRNPTAVRPWQHVLDALNGYLVIAEKLITDTGNPIWQDAWNFGPASADNIAVKEIVAWAANHWGSGKYELGISSADSFHEAGLLRLDCSKAQQYLDWKPVWNAKEAIAETIDWYKKVVINQEDPAEVTIAQIHSFLSVSK